MYKTKVGTLIFALGLVAAAGVLAQATPDLRGIEKSTADLLEGKSDGPANLTVPVAGAGAASTLSVDVLKEVQVNSRLLAQEISTYWLPYLRKPVSADQIAAFKGWLFTQLQRQGYLGFVDVAEQKADKQADIGSVLVVTVSSLVIERVTIVAHDDGPGRAYAEEVARRFSRQFPAGAVLDVAALESQLSAARYDLPVELDVDLRQQGAQQVEVVINLHSLRANPLSLNNGVVQANNYGLPQYGRGQLMAGLRLEGFTPLSALSLTALASERVGFFKADYDMPLMGTASHVHGWLSTSQSSTSVDSGSASVSASMARSSSNEAGVGLTTLLQATRYGTTQLFADLAARRTEDTLADLPTRNQLDKQLRLGLRTESRRQWVDSLRTEFALVAGHLDLSGNAADQAQDAASYERSGDYSRLEFNGDISQGVSSDGLLAFAARWRGQYAGKNLSSYNKITLGGSNGLRAYTTADGVADSGLGVSLDLTRAFGNVYAGLLYDAAWLQTSATPLAGTTDNTLLLQDAGFLLGGEVNRIQWNVSLAKSFGDAQNTTLDPTLTRTGDWRFNLELTRRF